MKNPSSFIKYRLYDTFMTHSYRGCLIWLRQINPIETDMSETRGPLLRLIWLRRLNQSMEWYEWDTLVTVDIDMTETPWPKLAQIWLRRPKFLSSLFLSSFIVRNIPDIWLRIIFWADIFGTCAWIALQRFSDFRKNYFFFQRFNFLLLDTDLKLLFEFFFVMTYVVIFVESYYISEWLKCQILILCWVLAYHMMYHQKLLNQKYRGYHIRV